MMLYIALKFPENISNGSRVIERTWNHKALTHSCIYWVFSLLKIPNSTLKVATSSLQNKGNSVKKTTIFTPSCARTDTQNFGRYSIIPRHFFFFFVAGHNEEQDGKRAMTKHTSPLRKHAYTNILKILPPKIEKFQLTNLNIFHISAQNIDCVYSLELPRWGGSNEYPQSMF